MPNKILDMNLKILWLQHDCSCAVFRKKFILPSVIIALRIRINLCQQMCFIVVYVRNYSATNVSNFSEHASSLFRDCFDNSLILANECKWSK